MGNDSACGFVKKRMANLGQDRELSDGQERRRALNEANKRARARFFAAEQALDKAMQECTAACAGKATHKWHDALGKYEAAIATHLKAAEMLPAGGKG